MARRETPEGIRITKVGVWFVLFTLLVAVAATNTGNNALYITLAVMFGALTISGVASRQNVSGLVVSLDLPGEIFANQMFSATFSLAGRRRFLPRWFLLFSLDGAGRKLLVPYLPRGGKSRGRIDLLLGTRGRHRVPNAHVSSLFPFGFFSKGTRYRLDEEVLVFPELFPSEGIHLAEAEPMGDDPSRRIGWGHDLHSLRSFRRGDDPRSIHWKQTARTGNMVYMERESERNRRLSILFDNGVGPLADPTAQQRFERLVSEAATAAVAHLARGYEIELVARDGRWPYATGARQRYAVLEALALIQPVAAAAEPLVANDPRAPFLALRLDTERAA